MTAEARALRKTLNIMRHDKIMSFGNSVARQNKSKVTKREQSVSPLVQVVVTLRTKWLLSWHMGRFLSYLRSNIQKIMTEKFKATETSQKAVNKNNLRFAVCCANLTLSLILPT